MSEALSLERCPVCEASGEETFLTRLGVPVHQNLILPDERAALDVTRGDLEMVVCRRCGFVRNRRFDGSLLSYGSHYDNTQVHSQSFHAYVDGLVAHLIEERGVRGARIVEVGCGKGGFLRRLIEYPGAANAGVGFDPAYVGPDTDLDGRLRFERSFYDDSCTDTPADVVVCRHVIEHVSRPVELLRTIRRALSDAPRARLFFETPCVEWILRNQVVWDFFYEHCSLFTESSLRTAFEAAEFTVTGSRHVFGGQYLWLEATLDGAASSASPPAVDAGPLVALTRAFAATFETNLRTWDDRLRHLAAEGCVAVWGAGAKGVTFANLLDPERQRIACVVDVNPNKQGHYLPGTAHPIVDYPELATYGVRTVIVMNPNYRDEIRELLARAGLAITLVEDTA